MQISFINKEYNFFWSVINWGMLPSLFFLNHRLQSAEKKLSAEQGNTKSSAKLMIFWANVNYLHFTLARITFFSKIFAFTHKIDCKGKYLGFNANKRDSVFFAIVSSPKNNLLVKCLNDRVRYFATLPRLLENTPNLSGILWPLLNLS